jgi:hypothetical protein
VFVTERDLFLAHSLQVAADSIPMHAMPGRVGEGADPVVVVGVVGIGHVPGILSNWGKVTQDDVRWVDVRISDPHSI